jgi:hypothetical protein
MTRTPIAGGSAIRSTPRVRAELLAPIIDRRERCQIRI